MAHKNTQALADLWVRGQITRGDIKGFRIGIGKPVAEEFNDQYIDKRA
jgi:hypothetical protein